MLTHAVLSDLDVEMRSFNFKVIWSFLYAGFSFFFFFLNYAKVLVFSYLLRRILIVSVKVCDLWETWWLL